MIIEFSVGNYKSFKEAVTLSLVAANITSKGDIDEQNVCQVSDQLGLLKSAAIYGANASGKSNLIDALRFMRWFVRTSANMEVDEQIPVDRFRLSENTEEEPAYFQIVFLLDGKHIRYGFEVTETEVVAEWLFIAYTAKESKLFERDRKEFQLSARNFKEGKDLQSKTKPNSLFLTVVAQFNGQIASEIVGWFRMLRVYSGGLKDMLDYQYTASLLKSDKHRAEVMQLIQRLDLDIQDVKLERRDFASLNFSEAEEFPDEISDAASKLVKYIVNRDPTHEVAKTYHKTYDRDGKRRPIPAEFLISQESAGTQKLFTLAGSLYDVLKGGKILVIDELDARLHPIITRTIIELFNSKATNPKNAQLIFSTHDVNLLNNRLFRRDQIWFTEKDSYCATRLYSLVEFKVRNDAVYNNDYIRGKYGAIPFIGDLEQLLGEHDGA